MELPGEKASQMKKVVVVVTVATEAEGVRGFVAAVGEIQWE